MEQDGSSANNYQMYNPVIFTTGLIADGEDYNTVYGAGFKIVPFKKTGIYTTVVRQGGNDELYGTQVGVYQFIFKSLRILLEYNHMDKFLLAQDEKLTYTHYNQALGNPLGTGFDETVIKLNYRWRRLLVDLQMNISTFEAGEDIHASNFVEGQDIFAGKFGTFLNRRKILIGSIELAYLLNSATNLKVFGNYTLRDETKHRELPPDNSSNFFYFGIRTDLRNIYYDF